MGLWMNALCNRLWFAAFNQLCAKYNSIYELQNAMDRRTQLRHSLNK